MKSKLFSKFKMNGVGEFKNRFVMSAMTRGFADKDHCATDQILKYYVQRAKNNVGLIITEGIIIHPSADGYNNVPHLNSIEQMQSWKKIVDAVHTHNSRMYAQLWHCGRISHEDYTNGYEVVSSTNNPAEGINRQNQKPFGKPRALTKGEMNKIYDMFGHSAELSIKAGFDGIQIHMGHGYLIDQFLDANVNDRQDEYGGSIDNRIRFSLELLESLKNRISLDKVSVRISPSRMMNGIYEWPDKILMLKRLLKEFDIIGLRQLDISCANSNYYETSGKIIREIRHLWPHILIGGASLSKKEALNEVDEGYLDMVTWGRAFIANPNLVDLMLKDLPYKKFDNSMRETLI